MLTAKQALFYDEQLHPAFAGYLHDGSISSKDALAAIFHLLTKGLVDPIWEDGSMNKKIVGIKKTISYDFENKIIPLARKKYIELYEFIKKHPLPKHRFINEFLSFNIAFGFDDSWFKDFNLDKEIKISETPITKGDVAKTRRD